VSVHSRGSVSAASLARLNTQHKICHHLLIYVVHFLITLLPCNYEPLKGKCLHEFNNSDNDTMQAAFWEFYMHYFICSSQREVLLVFLLQKRIWKLITVNWQTSWWMGQDLNSGILVLELTLVGHSILSSITIVFEMCWKEWLYEITHSDINKAMYVILATWWTLFLFCLILVVLGFELRALWLLGKCFTSLARSPAPHSKLLVNYKFGERICF
jgi:hypothetical protein